MFLHQTMRFILLNVAGRAQTFALNVIGNKILYMYAILSCI